MTRVARQMRFPAQAGRGNEVAALLMDDARARIGGIIALVSEPPQRTDLQPLGGIGFAR